MADDNKSLEERIARLEKGQRIIEDDLKELRGEIRSIHTRINGIIDNELAHLQQEVKKQQLNKTFWVKILAAACGAGGIATLILKFVLEMLFP